MDDGRLGQRGDREAEVALVGAGGLALREFVPLRVEPFRVLGERLDDGGVLVEDIDRGLCTCGEEGWERGGEHVTRAVQALVPYRHLVADAEASARAERVSERASDNLDLFAVHAEKLRESASFLAKHAEACALVEEDAELVLVLQRHDLAQRAQVAVVVVEGLDDEELAHEFLGVGGHRFD